MVLSPMVQTNKLISSHSALMPLRVERCSKRIRRRVNPVFIRSMVRSGITWLQRSSSVGAPRSLSVGTMVTTAPQIDWQARAGVRTERAQPVEAGAAGRGASPEPASVAVAQVGGRARTKQQVNADTRTRKQRTPWHARSLARCRPHNSAEPQAWGSTRPEL